MSIQKYSGVKKHSQLVKTEPKFSIETLNMASDCLSEIRKTVTNLDLALNYLEVFPITEKSIGIEFEYIKNQFKFKLFLDILENTFKIYYVLNDSLFPINITDITEINRLL